MSSYLVNRSDGSVLTTLNSLEFDGPNNVSTPRQIIDTQPDYPIIQIVVPNVIQIQGSFVARFPAGTPFTVSGAATPANNGVKTVVSATYFLGPNETHITVTAGIVPEIPPPGAKITQHTVFMLFEDLTYRFVPTFTFTVQDSTFNNGLYTVSVFSSVFHAPHTLIFTTGPIVAPGVNLGEIVYTIGSSTSLLLPGKGVVNFGERGVVENLVHLLEHFADSTPPPGSPMVGQLWYDTTTGPASDLYRHWDGSIWSSDVSMSSGTLTFADPQNANQPAFMEITGDDTDDGLRIRTTNNPPAGNSVFRVTDSAGLAGDALLRVEYSGFVSTTEGLKVAKDVFVDLNVLVVDTLNNRVGINKLVPTVALDVVGDMAVDTNTLFVDSTNNRVGVGLVLPLSPLHVAGDVRSDSTFIGSLGTALVPTYTFLGDLDTGMYQGALALNTISFAIGGAQKVKFDSTGITVFSGFFSPGINDPTNPEFSFTNDPDTGMYHSTPNTLAITAGGFQRAFFSDTSFSINPGQVLAPAASLIAGAGNALIGTGGGLFIEGGPGGTTSGAGGLLTLRGGIPVGGGDGGGIDILGRPGSAGNNSGGTIQIFSGAATGTGTAGSISLLAATSPSGVNGIISFRTGSAQRLVLDALGNIILGPEIGSGVLATTATNGFLYISTMPGTPTGIPTSYAGRAPIVFDSSGNTLYAYDGGWVNISGGSPGGANTQVQYNDGGVFGGDPDFTFDETTSTLALNGVISNAVGTAALPSYTFTGDLDTGMYHSAADQVSVAIAGAEKIRFSSAGVTVFSGFFSPGANTPLTPEFSFTNDPDTGIFRSAADTIDFTTGGVSRFSVGNSTVSMTNFSWDSVGNTLTLGVSGGASPTIRAVTSSTLGAALNINAGQTTGVGVTGGTLQLQGGSTVDANAGTVNILGGTASGTNRSGGAINITAGSSTGTAIGATNTLTGGEGGATGTGGTIILQGGFGGSTSGAGGEVIVRGGQVSTDGNGGGVTIAGRSGLGTSRSGGTILLTAGTSTTANIGGGITLLAGQGGPTGQGGTVLLTGGQGGSTSGTGGQVTIQGGTTTDGNGGSIAINPANATGTNRTGGTLTLSAGTSTGTANGGTVSITSGQGGPTGNGGTLAITPGAGGTTSGTGGQLTLQGGSAFDGNGGNLFATAGNAVGTDRTGGTLLLRAGNSTGTATGGSATLSAGQAGATGAGGTLIISAGAGGSTSGNGGLLTLQGGTSTNGNGGGVTVAGRDGVGTNRNGGTINLTGGTPTGTGTAGDINLTVNAGGLITTASSGGFQRSRSGNFATPGDAQSNEYILRTVTTDATITEMFLDGTGGTRRMVLPSDSTWAFHIQVVARRTDADNESAEYSRKGAIDNNAGTTALVAAVQTIGTDLEDTAAWDITITADDTNDALRIQVTGEVGKNIRWVAFVRTVEISE